jgi:Domain of unknown function (DUF4129)
MALKPNSTIRICLLLALALAGQMAAQNTEMRSLAASTVPLLPDTQTQMSGEGGGTAFNEAYWKQQVRDKTFEEADPGASKPGQTPNPKAENKPQADYLAYLWLIPVLLLLIVLLIKIIPLINKRAEARQSKPIAVTRMPASAEAFAADGLQDLQTALQTGEYRAAIRLRYIGALKQLSDRGLIAYRKDLSNGDYLQQLKGKAEYEAFCKLTTHFNAVRYGQAPGDEALYRLMDPYFIEIEQAPSAF